nr:aspartyl/glutamyl-tRNA(Asn/Gln) amidotransferase subunit B [uncultured archaeon]
MNIDYKKIGLKSGIEIHQQIDTNKLFCECPSVLRVEEPHSRTRRKLHAVAGETGKIDIAADYEHKREREFVYEGYSDSTCLVELDEEPPHEINEEALKIALQISLLLNTKPIEITQVMRKTVIDGSNTSGFQRTVLIARDGSIETASGKIGIQSVCLEEDAARIISQDDKEVTYRLDRLGIPLIEIATSPDIKNPEQAKEVALHIGEILRACKVKRGIGTIRQDVNMSINNGYRVEIKGVQEPALISRTIMTEIERQQKEKLGGGEVRKANPDGSTSYLRPLPGAARMYPETDIPLIKISRDMINEIKKSLPRLKHEIRAELESTGLNPELTKLLLQENKLEEFKELLSVYNNPNLIVKLLILYPREIASHDGIPLGKINERVTLDVIEELLLKTKKGEISEEHMKAILSDIAQGKQISEIKIEKTDNKEIEEFIGATVKEKPNLGINAYMGLVMQKFKGKISGKEVIEILKKYIK